LTLQKKTLDPYFKGAVVTSLDEVLYLNKFYRKRMKFNVLDEVVLSLPCVFYLQKDSYLTEVFNEKIDNMRSAGLVDYWISKYLEMKYLGTRKKKPVPRKLNFQELYGAFQVWMFGVVCSALTFAAEAIHQTMNKKKTKHQHDTETN